MVGLGNWATGLEAQEKATGAASFTRLGSSARAIAMGRAYTALAGEDALAMFWNPAGINSESEQARFAITDRAVGDRELGLGGLSSFISAGGAMPIGHKMAVGFGLMYYGVDGIEQYNERAVYRGDFSNSEMLLLATIARREEPLVVGVSIKYISQSFKGLKDDVGVAGASGIGLDVGLLAHFWKPVRIGFTLKNKTDLENDRVPTSASVGIAYERYLSLGALSPRLVMALDVEQVKYRPIRFHLGLGLERLLDFNQFGFSLRFGRNNQFLEKRLGDNLESTFAADLEGEDLAGANARWGIGMGIDRQNFMLDYTFSLGLLHDPHYISLSYAY